MADISRDELKAWAHSQVERFFSENENVEVVLRSPIETYGEDADGNVLRRIVGPPELVVSVVTND